MKKFIKSVISFLEEIDSEYSDSEKLKTSSEDENLNNKEEQEEQKEQEDPAPEPLPDEIDIPWPAIANVKNVQQYCDSLDNKIKEALHRNRWEEKNLFQNLEKTEEDLKQMITKLYKDFKIPSSLEFEILIPSVAGKPGKFKRRKPLKPESNPEPPQPENKDQQS